MRKHDGSDNAEICDGIDNDGDGKVDNLDRAGDGICDCLRIATLGKKGVHSSNVFADWVDGKSDHPVLSLGTDDSAAEITAAILAPLEVIVLQNLEGFNEFTPAELKAIGDWVNDGGGLMTLTGYSGGGAFVRVNSILAAANIAYSGSTFNGPANDFWHATHPTANLISAIGFKGGYTVDDLDSMGVNVAEEGGNVVAVAKEVGNGKVFAWGDEWITFNSEWANSGFQVEQFWINLIHWLTPQNACEIDVVVVD